MEPFKTLYFGYEGAAYPCCYKHIMWGDIEKQQAHEIWQSDLMRSLRNPSFDFPDQTSQKNSVSH
ncbi:SPASM domain-containing protein [Thiolapillus sp.]